MNQKDRLLGILMISWRKSFLHLQAVQPLFVRGQVQPSGNEIVFRKMLSASMPSAVQYAPATLLVLGTYVDAESMVRDDFFENGSTVSLVDTIVLYGCQVFWDMLLQMMKVILHS